MIRVFLTALLLLTLADLKLSVADEKSFTMATYNIRFASRKDGKDVWPNRREFVIRYAKDIDIIGMQEVTGPQFDDLRTGLPEFSDYGVGRDDGKSGGEHAPILYRRSRFELADKGTFWLSESPEAIGKKGWDAALPRTCTWVILKDRKTEEEIFLANTHFDHRGENARLKSGKLIAERINQLSNDRPTVVMGDFNCLPDSKPYDEIASTFADARDAARSKPTGPSSTWNGFKKIEPDRIIDHIFVRSIDVMQMATDDPRTTDGRFASDHLPVRMVVHLDNGNQQ